MNFRQGEIWYANLNPIKGSEQAGQRPRIYNKKTIERCIFSPILGVPKKTSWRIFIPFEIRFSDKNCCLIYFKDVF